MAFAFCRCSGDSLRNEREARVDSPQNAPADALSAVHRRHPLLWAAAVAGVVDGALVSRDRFCAAAAMTTSFPARNPDQRWAQTLKSKGINPQVNKKCM